MIINNLIIKEGNIIKNLSYVITKYKMYRLIDTRCGRLLAGELEMEGGAELILKSGW